ncbi:MAG: NADH-quinone oxidoreductase subunit C, partial [Segetibacter sp.]
MPLTNPDIIQTLVGKFGEALTEFGEPYGMLTFSAPREMNMEVMRFLYEDQNLGFQFLTDLCAVHYPERKGEELAVVYHMHNLVENVRLRFKVYLPVDQPDV